MKKYILYSAILVFAISFLHILASIHVASKTNPGMNDGTIKSSRQAWHIAPHGIAIDSNNYLYLGVPNLIMVYDTQGNFLHSFTVSTSGTYSFTVDEEDNLIVAVVRSNLVKVYNQAGVLVKEIDDTGNEEYTRLYKKRSVAKRTSGETYIASNRFGYTQVKSTNGAVVYQIPFCLYLVKLAFPLAFISLATILSWGAIKFYSYVYSYLGHNGGKQ